MRPLSESLTVLIATAEDVVRRPAQVPAALPPAFAELFAEIRHCDARPAEGVRCTAAALVMMTAIEEFFAGAHEKTSPWLMLAGCTLPLLRTAAWVAWNNEREARG
jgi:hypothetical protein